MMSNMRCLWSLALFSVAESGSLELQNNVVKATVDDKLGLTGLSEKASHGASLSFSADSWSIQLGGQVMSPSSGCKQTSSGLSGPMKASLNYTCGDYDIEVAYSLKLDGAFVEKRLGVATNSGNMSFKSWTLFDGIKGSLDSLQSRNSAPSWHVQGNPFNRGLNIAGFLRWPAAGRGAFVSIANPWGQFTASAPGSDCVSGANHVGDDLPGMPLRNLDIEACKSECAKNSECKGFVFLMKGCEKQPSDACYLKKNAAPTSQGEDCSCLSQKQQLAGQEDAALAISAKYAADYTHDTKLQGQWFHTEPAVIGLTAFTKYTNEGLNTGERVAFMRCVESYYLDNPARQKKTVKVNVAWDENDYQIDVGTEEGRTQYKRIIDRNSQFGVTHIVYEPRNTLHSSRYNTTDGWGWEEALWLSMGELLREGKWDPRTDAVPEDILGMVKYAGDRGVKLLAYAYPCLPFEKMRQYFVASGSNSLSLAPPQVQAYFIDVMTAFLKKSGAAGFAWDHNIFAGNSDLVYAQWRAWMNILGTLRERFPDMVMDHRQTNHAWGPWYQLAGSYAEPIAGDENPETYGVPIPSLHTDHVAADNTRRINYVYSTQQLLPQSRVPGFVFHQSERTDDDGHFYCTKNEHVCYNNSNTRDFDYLGYKYSLLSTVGTAGLNNVLTMIPARDMAEFTLFPKEDVSFIHSWLAWTDTNIDKLRNAQWIPTLKGPGIGNVDGTHAMAADEGFIFLFNPNMGEMKVNLTIDESLGITNASAASEWKVVELYPREGAAVATWKHGESVEASVGGSDARVLAITKTGVGVHTARLTHATTVSAEVSDASHDLELTAVTGPMGMEVVVGTHLGADANSSAPARVSVNGVHCGVTSAAEASVAVQFGGEPALRAMPVSPDKPPSDFSGGWFNTTFSIPNSVKQQLEERAKKYPIPWTRSAQGCGLPHCVDDSKATWLIPSRLLLNPFIAHPNDKMVIDLYIDGNKVELEKSYNSRGRSVSRCFLAFYYDASDVTANTPHKLAVHLPPMGKGDFQGLFWENVETQYTSEVTSCRLLPERHALGSSVYI